MSDEQAMTIIENLSEELGEKELKIMALEKELEEQKKQKLEYLEILEIRNYKLDHFVDMSEHGNAEEFWCPEWLLDNELNSDILNDDESLYKEDIVIKVILSEFGGRLMKDEDIFVGTKYDTFEQLNEDPENECTVIKINDKECWVSDEW